MDWKGPIAATFFAAVVLCAGFWTEPMFPLGDDRWGVLTGVGLLGIVAIYSPGIYRYIRRRLSRAPQPEGPQLVDYMTACAIARRYIDLDEPWQGARLSPCARKFSQGLTRWLVRGSEISTTASFYTCGFRRMQRDVSSRIKTKSPNGRSA